jgi:hypothetical protein
MSRRLPLPSTAGYYPSQATEAITTGLDQFKVSLNNKIYLRIGTRLNTILFEKNGACPH